MSTAKFIVIAQQELDDAPAQYTARIDENSINDITLDVRYDGPHWTQSVRGETCIKLHDHGNGIDVKMHERNGKIKLDYAEAVDLYMALDVYYRERGMPITVKRYLEKE